MKRRAFLFWMLAASWVALPVACVAQPRTGLLFREVQVGSTTYRYEVFVPPTWNPREEWPVILFLHGAGHRGEYAPGETESLLGKRFVGYQKQNAAVVVFPRCRSKAWWSDPDMEAMAMKALEHTMKEFRGDARRVYLTGLSMGGYGAWHLAARHPGKFAAVAPVCGGIRTPPTIAIPPVSKAWDPYAEVARRIGKTPVWIFHGSADHTISVEESRKMAQALKAAGGNVRYTEYKGVGHNSWDRAYAEPEFFRWLLAQHLAP